MTLSSIKELDNILTPCYNHTLSFVTVGASYSSAPSRKKRSYASGGGYGAAEYLSGGKRHRSDRSESAASSYSSFQHDDALNRNSKHVCPFVPSITAPSSRLIPLLLQFEASKNSFISKGSVHVSTVVTSFWYDIWSC